VPSTLVPGARAAAALHGAPLERGGGLRRPSLLRAGGIDRGCRAGRRDAVGAPLPVAARDCGWVRFETA